MRRLLALLISVPALLAGCNGSQDSPSNGGEQAVIVRFAYGTSDLSALYEVEDKLEAVVKSSNTGEFDGHEIAIDASEGIYYMYGPSADKLFDAVRPVLEAALFTRSAKVTLRYGPAKEGTPAKEVALGT